MSKRKKKICIQCKELLLVKDNFYKINRRRTFPRCKRCISLNNRSKRIDVYLVERECPKCSIIKSVDQFKSSHGNSTCISCTSKTTERINDIKESTCIICGDLKPRDQFNKIFRKGSKCKDCLKLKKNEGNLQRTLNRIKSGEVFDHGSCSQCREVKSSDCFTRLDSWNGLAYQCNECKKLNQINLVRKREARSVEREAEKKLSILQRPRDKFEKRLDAMLAKHPDCRIMNEIEYDGYTVTPDGYVREIERSRAIRLNRSTEHLYFKYFAPDKSMDDHYVDFSTMKLIKFGTLSKRGRPSTNVNRIKKIERDRKRQDPIWRLKNSITSRFCQWMQGTKTKSTWKYVDYTLGELKEHLEALFVDGMTWENYGLTGWHVDHVIPRDNFDMNSPSDIVECWKMSNLQPLWAEDNLKKSNKVLDKPSNT